MPRSKSRPRSLHPAINICLVIVAVVVLSTTAGPSSSRASSVDGWEADLQRLTNVDRTSNGLSALLPHLGLYGIARGRSDDMIARQYFSHSIPGGGNAGDIINAQGIPYRLWGENIGHANVDDDSVVNYLESLWLSSPMHRANIMNPAYTHLGVGAAEGVFEGSDGTKMFTALFLQAPAATGPPPAPTNVASPPPPSPTRKPPPPMRTLPPTARPRPPTHTPMRLAPPTKAPNTPAALSKPRTPGPTVAPQQTQQTQQLHVPTGTPYAVPPTNTFPPAIFTQAPHTATPVPPSMTATSAPDTATPTSLPATATRTATPSPMRAVVMPPANPRAAQPPPKGSGRLFDEIVDRLLRGLLNF